MQTAKNHPQEEFARIPLSQLVFSTFNARKFEANMDASRAQKFSELVTSVRVKGVIQPILVRPLDFDTYEVIAGERRTRAMLEMAKQDGRNPADLTLPAIIRDVTQEEAEELMLVENAKREDLTPIEQAEGFADYLSRRGNTPEALAELALQTSTPSQTIRRMVNLLSLPSAVLDKWREGSLSFGHVELFLRLADEKVILKALTDTLSNKLTVKELKACIENAAPALEIAKFGREDCCGCAHNSSAQGDLFGNADQAAKCLHPSCFEQKQGEFFRANWEKGKARTILGTNDFRFSHRLDASSFQVIPLPRENALPERCVACAECVSVVQLGGEIVKERACVGAKTCFDDIFMAPAKRAAQEKSTAAPAPVKSGPENESGGAEPKPKSTAKGGKSKAASGKPEDESAHDPKRAARRGQEFREKFYAAALPAKIGETAPNSPAAIRLALAALALANSSAKDTLLSLLGASKHGDLRHDTGGLVAGVFGLDDQQILPALRDMAAQVFMATDMHASADPGSRHSLAQGLGIDLAAEFTLTEDYLAAMTKRELVAMGEEPQVALWKDPRIMAHKETVAPKQALMSIKKPDLVKLVLDSGADLRGRAPNEITQIIKR